MSYLINQITEKFLSEKVIASKSGTGPGYYVKASTADYILNTGFWNNIGTQDFTIVAEFTPNSTVWQVIANSAGTEVMLSSAQLLIGDLTVYPIPSYTFVVGQKYVICLSADRDGNASYYVNGKLVGLIDISAGAANALAGNLRAFRGSLTASQTGHRLSIFNRALTASEIEQVSNGQYLGFADYGASGAASYTSDFSVDLNGWTSAGGTATANVDGIGGEDNVLRLTVDTSTGLHYMSKNSLMTIGKRYRATGKIFIPSTNSHVDRVIVQPTNSAFFADVSVLDTWVNFSGEVLPTVALSSDLVVAAYDGASFSFTDPGGGDVIYIKDFVITPIGLVLDLNEWGMSPTQWFDHSGNSYNGAVIGATRINPISLAADKHVSLTNLPTSASGLDAGRVWNDAGTLKIVT